MTIDAESELGKRAKSVTRDDIADVLVCATCLLSHIGLVVLCEDHILLL